MRTKTKKKIKHLLTRKKILHKRHSKHLLRGVFIVVGAVATGSLAFAITTTKPTVNIKIQPNSSTTKVTDISPVSGADQVGVASWYAFGLPAPDALTCASTTFPRGTYLQVTNRRNGRSVICLVNDYGPEAWTGRQLDLSRGAFRVIEDLGAGTVPVIIKVVPPQLGINLRLSQTLATIVGYQVCHDQFSAQYCEDNRQKAK